MMNARLGNKLPRPRAGAEMTSLLPEIIINNSKCK